MKLKKILTLACCAVLLVCISVGATVAYLTSQATVTNTFTVGKVQISMDEAAIKKDETTGNWVEDNTKDRVVANSYNLLPGISYAKDPTVTVKANSEDCYVRALVTITKAKELDEIFADQNGANMAEIFGGLSTDWTCNSITKDTGNNTRTYEMRYKEVVKKSSSDQVLDDIFEKVNVPSFITNNDLAKIDGMKIEVVAHAIQADGFADADAAWAATAF